MLPFKIRPLYFWVSSFILLQWLIMALLPLSGTSEPRYAAIAQLVLLKNDWITPWFDTNTPFWGKPPLSFWLQASAFSIFGISEWAVRFPSWVAQIIVSLLLLSTSKTKFISSNSAWLAVFIYNTMLLSFISSGAVLTDPFFNLGLCLTWISFLQLQSTIKKHWQYSFFLGLVISTLAKGPLAIILSFFPLVLLGLTDRLKTKNILSTLPWVSGLFLFLCLVTPWFVLAEYQTPGFLNYFFIGEHFQRFLDPGWQGDLYGTAHKEPLGKIWLNFVLASLPWGIVFFAFLIKNLITKTKIESFFSFTNCYLIFLSLTPLLFFTLAHNILWTYVLPSLAPFSLLIAPWLARWAFLQRIKPLVLLLVPCCALLLIGISLIQPNLLNTEKNIAQSFLRTSGPNDVLYFLEPPSFSARFYSHERTDILPQTVTEPNFLVLHKNHSFPFNLSSYQIIASSKYYYLYKKSPL